ncbi:MAG: hypothetical protein QOJ39_2591 [Candidatus Eremiobacteraeota bacterium]|jgi:hypothetical protein|nr:hypothetical protein [Candidatus Eremiobacteraeota bacterium]MEA2720727.1 hypothetical protein [Candidatus Eremiobacteraeota bacterium]
MAAPPMRLSQNAVALAATLLAAGALLPLEPRVRLLCAGLAFAVILVLLVVRLRAHSARRDDDRVTGVYDRIARIREERSKRRR